MQMGVSECKWQVCQIFFFTKTLEVVQLSLQILYQLYPSSV